MGSKQRAAAQPNINGKEYSALTLPLPPLSEQRRIVEILDQADALRKKRAEADRKAERLLPALFLHTFGDPATNPMGWEMKTLGELSVIGGEYGANASSKELDPGSPRYIRITDIQDNGQLNPASPVGIDLKDSRRFLLHKGDLLFARTGATVGKCYAHKLQDGECVYAGYLVRFRVDEEMVQPSFVFAIIRTTYYENWVNSMKRDAARANINAKEYQSLRIPLPPLTFQKSFDQTASAISDRLREAAFSKSKLDRLFNRLEWLAFSGDLTATWREGRMKELLQEMEEQAKLLSTTGGKR